MPKGRRILDIASDEVEYDGLTLPFLQIYTIGGDMWMTSFVSSNLIHPTQFNSHIKFTYEAEQNFVLPFLDILIIRTPNKFHFTDIIKENIHTLFPNHIQNNKKARIISILIKAGYPRSFIYRHFYDPSASKSTTIHRTSCFLPYSTSSLAISRILRPFGIKVYYNISPCLATILRHPITKADNPKLPIHSTGAVYVVSCQDCSSTYVGETGRTTYIRLTEHKRNIHNKYPKSLIYQHTAQTGHQFNSDQLKILYRSSDNEEELRDDDHVGKRPSNEEAFHCLKAIMKWLEQQEECNTLQLLSLKR
ncbi:hypothetical protein LAZ67_4003189 [Cordylochernes scorpioides]|uniref:GIY-YIG domain-containing protein n=1 Tax=Cordylochernes scorpioides TaxID=51811 RepID=A0ABY6KF85_9ARAC|nr:hypothetical protein LAZ67_4003189 [Cordylochernes scorpioides]